MSTKRSHAPWLPTPMAAPPALDPNAIPGPLRRRYALLLNPFYRKNPHASFGKHVLTPTLALTSIAAATPAHWQVSYWDENLLQGLPPLDPFPEVVAISVHLTFAKRAYELARWYRHWGAKVILGGLHVLTAPEEAADFLSYLQRFRSKSGMADTAPAWQSVCRILMSSNEFIYVD